MKSIVSKPIAIAAVLLLNGCSYVVFRPACESFVTFEEKRACEKGRAQAVEENGRERLYRAERYGYDVYRDRTGYSVPSDSGRTSVIRAPHGRNKVKRSHKRR